MIKQYTTVCIDMYGVILKESKGNFLPYIYEHFDESHHERLEKLIRSRKLFTKAQLGQISSHEFLSALGFEDPQFHYKNYVENHLTPDEGFFEFAEKINGRYDLVLISNDVAEWSEHITKFYGLDKYFTHKIISADVGCRKPDFGIFDRFLEISGKSARECIFVDNSAKNLVAAEEVGMSPILFNRDNEHYDGAEVFNFKELYNLIG